MHQVHFEVAMKRCAASLQRTNGRIAMIAFVGAAAAELATGKSVLEQATASPAFITFMTLLLTAAGFMPKIASGVSLSRLLDAAGVLPRLMADQFQDCQVMDCLQLKMLRISAGREGLPKELSFFNKTHEIWLGRVAMYASSPLQKGDTPSPVCRLDSPLLCGKDLI